MYELSATFDNQGDWAAIGFLTNVGNLETRIFDNGVRLWCLTRQADASNRDQAFLGPGTTGPLGDASTTSAAELKIHLETKTATQWLVTWYFDGVCRASSKPLTPAGFRSPTPLSVPTVPSAR